MDKVRIGIIGCGGIANNKHMPSLKKVEQAEMVAFCDIIEERAQKAAKEYTCPASKPMRTRPIWWPSVISSRSGP